MRGYGRLAAGSVLSARSPMQALDRFFSRMLSPASAATWDCAPSRVLGVWRFDAISPSRSRSAEARRCSSASIPPMLDRAEPATPVVDINATNFGLITGAAAKSTLHRQFPGFAALYVLKPVSSLQ